jgi:hypothetical protein
MLNVTRDAYARLSELLAKRPNHVAARIVRREGRLALRRSQQRRGDEVFVHDGRIVLLLGKNVCSDLEGRTLEVRATQDGPRLRFRRPARQD